MASPARRSVTDPSVGLRKNRIRARLGLEFGVWGSGFRVKGLGFGFRVWGLGFEFGISGVRFRGHVTKSAEATAFWFSFKLYRFTLRVQDSLSRDPSPTYEPWVSGLCTGTL